MHNYKHDCNNDNNRNIGSHLHACTLHSQQQPLTRCCFGRLIIKVFFDSVHITARLTVTTCLCHPSKNPAMRCLPRGCQMWHGTCWPRHATFNYWHLSKPNVHKHIKQPQRTPTQPHHHCQNRTTTTIAFRFRIVLRNGCCRERCKVAITTPLPGTPHAGSARPSCSARHVSHMNLPSLSWYRLWCEFLQLSLGAGPVNLGVGGLVATVDQPLLHCPARPPDCKPL